MFYCAWYVQYCVGLNHVYSPVKGTVLGGTGFESTVISCFIVCEGSVLSSKQSNACIGLYEHPLHRYTIGTQAIMRHAVFWKIISKNVFICQ